MNHYHLKPDITTNKDNETKLRKIATKGVILLFTAVSTAQTSEAKKQKRIQQSTVTVGGQKRSVNELESKTFLSLLKEKGNKDEETNKTNVKQEETKPKKKKCVGLSIRR